MAEITVLARKRMSGIIEAAFSEKQLRGRVDLAPDVPRSQRWQAEVVIVGAAAMRRLNRDYLGKDYATDVLSFPSGSPFMERGVLGELVVCETVLKRQAKENQITVPMELEVLLVHGLLHLLGFDHERSEREAREMARWERKLLLKLCPRSWITASKGKCLEGLILRVKESKKKI